MRRRSNKNPAQNFAGVAPLTFGDPGYRPGRSRVGNSVQRRTSVGPELPEYVSSPRPSGNVLEV